MKKPRKFPRILVCTPHNDVKNYCFDDFLSLVTNLTYKNYDVLIADNSKDNRNAKRIMKAGANSVHVKPRDRDNQQYIADSQEYLRDAVLRGKYDYMLMLESDVFPPLDIIERLLMHRKKVVGASYFIDRGHDSHLMIQEMESSGEFIRHTVNITNPHDIHYADGTLRKVYACGFGCLLIHKSVLKEIKFRWTKGVDAHSDSFLFGDLDRGKVPVFLDTAILCEHRNLSWATQLALQVPETKNIFQN